MAFWRRSKGRHALGAAVRSIPAGPAAPARLIQAAPVVQAPPPVPPPPVPPPPSLPPAAAAEPAPSYAPALPQEPLDWSFPELQPPPVTGPRVELTFRDGTSASLDGTQARALDEIAQALTRRH